MKFTMDWAEYAAKAREMAAEGCVLLRNERKTLPIRPDDTVSVFGRIQLHYYKSGTGSGGRVNAPYVVNIVDGLENGGTKLNRRLLDVYTAWVKEHPFDLGVGWANEPFSQEEMPLDRALVEEAAAESDVALVILGRSSGEDRDAESVPGSWFLSEREKEMLSLVTEYFPRTAVVLNTGSIMDMSWVESTNPGAVLYVWQGGQEGGNAAADVLTGRVNPSGKLSDTIARSIEDYPSAKDFGSGERNFYTEDIYVGYRYFETFAKDKVLYPFGFGLSYTEFSAECTEFAWDNDSISIKAKASNIGETAGKTVVQAYFAAPQGALGKPARQLVSFAKTKLLLPGESETVTLRFPFSAMASYDDSGLSGHKSAWVLEAGDYALYLGQDVRSAVFCGLVSVPETRVTEQLEEALSPVLPFRRIRPGKDGEIADEAVPVRSYDLAERILCRRPEGVPCTGDRGFRFKDVKEGRVTMEDFLAQLTDEELIPITRGEGMCSPKVTPGIAGSFGGVTKELQAYGIPVAGCSDGPSGIRMDCGTMAYSLPNGTLMACSFNAPLETELYDFEGRELRINHIDSLLGPGINIHRHPLNGRNFEYFSEDPYLTGVMAGAQLAGMHHYDVTGTIKHFAANSQEKRRHFCDSVISERALREIYLKAFEMCVKDYGARLIMSSYNPVNGLWTAGSYDLNTTILRNQWGFAGMVMTDWWARMNDEGGEGSAQNTTAMVRAQNDVFMVAGDAASNSMSDNTAEGLSGGRITRGELLRNAANVCRVLCGLACSFFAEGGEDEAVEAGRPETSRGTVYEQPQTAVRPLEVGGEGQKLDISGLHTEADSLNRYRLVMPGIGAYILRMELASSLGELSQSTVTVKMNGTMIGSFTISGTGGESTVRDAKLMAFGSIENYADFYFAQSGIEVRSIEVLKDELPSFMRG